MDHWPRAFSAPVSRESTAHEYSRLPTQEPRLTAVNAGMLAKKLRRHTMNVVDSRSIRTSTNDELDGSSRVNSRQARHTVQIGATRTLEEQTPTKIVIEDEHEQFPALVKARQKELVESSPSEAPLFQSFIGIVIMINSLLMGIEIDIPWYGWSYFEQVFLCIYVVELVVRLKAFGKFFFSSLNEDIVWNILDFVIVISSVLDSWITPLCGLIAEKMSSASKADQKEDHGMSFAKFMMLMRLVRLMRILRLAKLVKSVQPLFILVSGFMSALQGVAWVLVLTIITLYAMGLLATSLIGKKMAFPPGVEVPADVLKPFNTVPNSMFTLFRVMSGAASDTEQVAIDHVTGDVPSMKLVFVFFMITSSWTLLSILTAVVSENMISTTGQHEEEAKLNTAEEDRNRHVQKVKQVFNAIDITGDGQVEPAEIEEFLADKNNAMATARHCRVPVRDVREVLQTVADTCGSETVSLESFVEHLADVSNVVTEKSIMRVEAKLANLSRQQSEAFTRLHKTLVSGQEKLNLAVSAKSKDSAETRSRAFDKSEFAPKGQLKEVEKFMQGLAEKTEACLTGIQKKSQAQFESMAKSLEQAPPRLGVDEFSKLLELHLHRMQDEFASKRRGQEPAVHEQQTDLADIAAKSGAPVEPSLAPIDVRLLAIEESIHSLQHRMTFMLRQNEGALEQMSKTGHSSLAVDDFSETLEHKLRMMRHELLCLVGHQSPDFLKSRDAPGSPEIRCEPGENDKQPVASAEIETDVPGASVRLLAAQIGARLLVTEESIHGLQQTAEAMLRKIEGLLDKAASQGDKFSENVDGELRSMQQELLKLVNILGAQDSEGRLGASAHTPRITA